MITKSVLVFGAGVFALSFATVTATAAELFGLTRDELIAKFGPAPAHLKGTTGMIGLFVNPWHE